MEKIFNEAANKGGIYRIRNKINGIPYIGSAKCFKVRINQHENSLKNSKHKNPKLRNAFKKYGEDAFVFEVLEVIEGTVEERRTIEQRYIDEVWPNCYNTCRKTTKKQGPWSSTPEETRKKRSGKNHWAYGKHPSEETVAKRVEKFKGEKHWLFGEHHTEETRKKISESKSGANHQNYGKHLPEETRKKIKEANTGKHPTKETLKKLSESHKGQVAWNKGKKMEPLSAEHKKKIGVALKGRKCGPMSEEAKRKNSEAHKGEKHQNYGKHLSEETRKKISAAQKGKKKSAETRKKMSIARKGKKFPKRKQKE